MPKRNADKSKEAGQAHFAARTSQNEPVPGPGRYAYEELDRVLHERARLGILTSLVAQPDGLSFNDLKQLCSLTDGNLNRHLAVLADAQLVSVQKQQGEGRGQTTVRLTANGKRRFLDYVSALEAVVADAAAAERQSSPVLRGARRWSPA